MKIKFIKIIILGFFSVFIFISCSEEKKTQQKISKVIPIGEEFETAKRTLAEIKEYGKLRALTTYSATSYFLYKGRPMGYEFEMLERFSDYLGVELEIIVVKNVDELIAYLNAGKADILAHGLAVTSNRQEDVAFTEYLYLTHQVLVQRKPENWYKMKWHNIEKNVIQDAIELIGDTVSLRNNSSYKERISNLSSELGGEIIVDTVSGELVTDEIIKLVVDGEIKYTVADNNIASIMASYYPILDIEVPISFSQRIAWATRKESNDILDVANEWIEKFKKETDYYVIYNKYFKNKRAFKLREKSEFYSLNNQEISPYDNLIIKYNDKNLKWDWRLLTSLIYQESRFDPKTKSWASASGLMQIMPETARELGVKDRNDPEQSIKGGTKYLNSMWENFEHVEDSIQRIKFAMASYNCGLYHVKDAQKLAEKRGLKPAVWDNNVDEMILALSSPKNYQDPIIKYGYVRGEEPYNYVIQIFERYEHYKQFIKK